MNFFNKYKRNIKKGTNNSYTSLFLIMEIKRGEY